MALTDRDPCYCGSGKKFRSCCLPDVGKPLPPIPSLPSVEALIDYVTQQFSIEQILQVAVTLNNQGERIGAGKLCQYILTKRPKHAMAMFMLGSIMVAGGEYRIAEPLLLRSQALFPHNLDVYEKLLVLYEQQDKKIEAIKIGEAALKEADKQKRPDRKPFFLMALAYQWGKRDPKTAEQYVRQAIAIDPGQPSHHLMLAEVLRHQTRWREGRDIVDDIVQRFSMPQAFIIKLSMIPQIASSREEIAQIRQDFSRHLDVVEQLTPLSARNLLPMLSPTFYFAFHGEDNKPLFTRYSDILRRICPELNYTAPHCQPGAVREPGKFRIGFLSRFFRYHSVGNSFNGQIQIMADSGEFDIFLLSEGGGMDDTAAQLAAKCTAHIELGHTLEQSHHIVSQLKLDALIYLDIGMWPSIFALAHARLAPLQGVCGGHPDTTGISSIDVFFSWENFEPQGAQANYSERLVCFKEPIHMFPPPAMPSPVKSRAALGVPEDRTLYLCPMLLQKIHPEFDEITKAIAKADPKSCIVFFRDQNFAHIELIQKRFEHSLNEVKDHIHFCDFMPLEDLKSLALQAEVTLDPIHFGGGTTALILLGIGVPMVTWPGRFMRGRNTFAFLKQMGVLDTVVEKREEYVGRAVAIANDPALRAQIHEKLLANAPKLYANQGAAYEWMAWLKAELQRMQRQAV